MQEVPGSNPGFPTMFFYYCCLSWRHFFCVFSGNLVRFASWVLPFQYEVNIINARTFMLSYCRVHRIAENYSGGGANTVAQEKLDKLDEQLIAHLQMDGRT